MNRYDITNQRNGKAFVILGTSFPPQGYETLWGDIARTKLLSACDFFEMARATNQRPDPSDITGSEFLVDLPADFVVTTTNIDADIAAQADADQKLEQAFTRLRNIKKSDLTTVGAIADAIMDLKKAVLRYARGDS